MTMPIKSSMNTPPVPPPPPPPIQHGLHRTPHLSVLNVASPHAPPQPNPLHPHSPPPAGMARLPSLRKLRDPVAREAVTKLQEFQDEARRAHK